MPLSALRSVVACALLVACETVAPAPPLAPAPATSPAPPLAPAPSDLDRLRETLALPTLAGARAYAINVHVERPGLDDLFDAEGRLNLDRAPEAGVALTTVQLARLVAALARPEDLIGAARCYYPHHGVVLEDDAGHRVGTISICLMCRNYSTELPGLGPAIDDTDLSALFEELGLPTQFPVDGLPPAPPPSLVRHELMRAVQFCRPRAPHTALPRASLRVAPDGTIHDLVGLPKSMRSCVLQRLHRQADHFVWVPVLPVNRDGATYEFALPP